MFSYKLMNFNYMFIYPQTHPDIAVRREIDKLPVYCENHENGCQWTGSLKDHEVCWEPMGRVFV